MPTNKNAMTRFQILDQLLSDRYHSYSIDELTEKVNIGLTSIDPKSDGVGRRTIEKDIKYLEYESPFMVEIERYADNGYNSEKQREFSKRCLRYLDPSFSIFHKKLSDDEIYLLREAMSLLGQFDGLPNLHQLEQLRLGLGMKENDRSIISFTKNPLENTSILGELFIAISQKQVVELYYHKFDTPDEINTIIVYPYLLKEYNRRWYLYCAAENGGRILCYSLDRINKIDSLPAHSYVSHNGDINEIFEDIIGVTWIENEPTYEIFLWASQDAASFILTKPIHDSQIYLKGKKAIELRKKFPKLTEGHFFLIKCKSNYELIRELSSFGKDLLVLEPTAVQDQVWIKIHELNEEYKTLRT